MADTTDLIRHALEVAALAEKATPGPWVDGGFWINAGLTGRARDHVDSVCEFSVPPKDADKALMIASPEMARLLGEMANALERAEGALFYLSQQIEGLGDEDIHEEAYTIAAERTGKDDAEPNGDDYVEALIRLCERR